MILLILNSPVVLLGASKAVSHGIFPDAGQNAPKMILARSGGWVSCEWTLEPIAFSTDTCVVYSRLRLHMRLDVLAFVPIAVHILSRILQHCVFSCPALIISSCVSS